MVTGCDPYPMPRVETMVEEVAGALFISKMDLTKGYYQVPLEEGEAPKTAFLAASGKYQFTTTPFGLKGAPAHFQRQMDLVLRGIAGCGVYIDDVVVYSMDWPTHLQYLRSVLTALREARLRIKAKKCTFGGATVSFLGYEIGGGMIRPQAAKVDAIANYKKPKTKKQLRAFLGLCGYYRRFVS